MVRSVATVLLVSDHVRAEPELAVSGPTGDPDQTSSVPASTEPDVISVPEATAESEAAPGGDPEPAVERPALLRIRRAPRYRPFGLTGAGLGVLAGVVLALSFSATSDYSIRTIIGYFAAILGMIGAVLGLGVAVLLERRPG
jgi:hypothetical protein